MNYPVTLEGFEGQSIEVKPAGTFTGPQLLVNGEKASKGPKRGQMALQRNDGRIVYATWKPQLFDVPQLLVEGKAIQLVKPLRWYEWVWGGLPLLLVFMGGAIGALTGMVAFAINAKVFRSELNGIVKYALTAAISFVALIVDILLSMLFMQMVRG